MENKDLYLEPEKVDNITKYGKVLEPKIDPNISIYKESMIRENKDYSDYREIINKTEDYSENRGMSR